MLTQDEVGLFTVAAAFGLGFPGIIPAFILAIRELFPASEAYWRIPLFLLCCVSGMAVAGWNQIGVFVCSGTNIPLFPPWVRSNTVLSATMGSLAMHHR